MMMIVIVMNTCCGWTSEGKSDLWCV